MATFDALSRFDWKKASQPQFNRLVDEFDVWLADNPVDDIELADGWHTITPEVALRILAKNKRNRKVNFMTVIYYGMQMAADDWPETGQPIIFTVHGDLGDAQHRLWASLVSGSTFSTYVVNQRKEIPNVFAYIDNSRPRSAADALMTAGFDSGLSPLMANAITMALYYDAGAYSPTTKRGIPRQSPNYYIFYANQNPKIREAANLMAGEHSDATDILRHKEVAVFVAFKILELHDEYVLDQFMEEVGSQNPESSAVIAFQAVMAHDRQSVEPMKKHQVLGYAIKAFNSWLAGEVVKKLKLSVNEDFPSFSGPLTEREAAE